VIELIPEEREAEERRRELGNGAVWLTAHELSALEPNAASFAGAVFYPEDGAVDNIALLHALRTLLKSGSSVTWIEERAVGLELSGEEPQVRLASGKTVSSSLVVLAAGAWTPLLEGLPHPLPIAPVRGQMYSVAASPLRHVTYGPKGYVVPRSPSLSLVGATMEHAGFEAGVTADGLTSLTTAASQIAPSLAGAPPVEQWSGFRPVTPDLLPILGKAPGIAGLIYACGHSRNGILLGPLSGECVAALASGEEPGVDLTPFTVSRFAKNTVTL
jgi:glycine oxidase